MAGLCFINEDCIADKVENIARCKSVRRPRQYSEILSTPLNHRRPLNLSFTQRAQRYVTSRGFCVYRLKMTKIRIYGELCIADIYLYKMCSTLNIIFFVVFYFCFNFRANGLAKSWSDTTVSQDIGAKQVIYIGGQHYTEDQPKIAAFLLSSFDGDFETGGPMMYKYLYNS